MKLRAPAYPLITVDPYFSVWSETDELNMSSPRHWTGSDMLIIGTVTIDGSEYRFMGPFNKEKVNIKQVYVNVNALTTTYVFENEKIELTVKFTTPAMMTDLYLLSRPVSYMAVSYKAADGKAHDVKVRVSVSEQICLNNPGDDKVTARKVVLNSRTKAMKMGSRSQKMLTRSGDDLRIEWGYFYLAVQGESVMDKCDIADMTNVFAEIALIEDEKRIFAFAYDDIKSINYFGDFVESYWKKDGITIEKAIIEALDGYDSLIVKCNDFSEKLHVDAERAGGTEYAELLELAYRHTVAGHKLALDTNGEVIYISKECFSNGCAATVDVTYPSQPIMLLYNSELLKGTLRPIFKFDSMDEWKFDFAPHDAGKYPLVTGQVYGLKNGELLYDQQMPVEESGNMLVMMANIAIVDGNADFAAPYMDILKSWTAYLVKYGADPENQLCTDDFAGHLAHNCNLSLKAVMGVTAYAILLDMMGKTQDAKEYMKKAQDLANNWLRTADNGDGSYRLAFDRPDTFSMKYNVIWDKLWGTKLFPHSALKEEFQSYNRHMLAYGLPLDSRKNYTKSDWLVWTSMLADSDKEFAEFVKPMWEGFNVTTARIPMTDWYDAATSMPSGGNKHFTQRTVQGGLFIKLLEKKLGYKFN